MKDYQTNSHLLVSQDKETLRYNLQNQKYCKYQDFLKRYQEVKSVFKISQKTIKILFNIIEEKVFILKFNNNLTINIGMLRNKHLKWPPALHLKKVVRV